MEESFGKEYSIGACLMLKIYQSPSSCAVKIDAFGEETESLLVRLAHPQQQVVRGWPAAGLRCAGMGCHRWSL